MSAHGSNETPTSPRTALEPPLSSLGATCPCARLAVAQLGREVPRRADDGGGELEAAPPVDPAPAAAAVLDALPAAFGGQDSDDSERGGDDDFNDNCEVPASEDAEMMGWDTYDDDYVGS